MPGNITNEYYVNYCDRIYVVIELCEGQRICVVPSNSWKEANAHVTHLGYTKGDWQVLGFQVATPVYPSQTA